MGIALGRRRNVREVILAHEVKIEETEKRVRSMRKRKIDMCSGAIVCMLFLNAFCILLVWVFKDVMSMKTIMKSALHVLAFDVILGMCIKLAEKMYEHRIRSNVQKLKQLKEAQRTNIEQLKKQTKYDDTHRIIERHRQAESSKEEAEESVVDKIVTNLI